MRTAKRSHRYLSLTISNGISFQTAPLCSSFSRASENSRNNSGTPTAASDRVAMDRLDKVGQKQGSIRSAAGEAGEVRCNLPREVSAAPCLRGRSSAPRRRDDLSLGGAVSGARTHQ